MNPRVVVGEDSLLVREGIVRALQHTGFEVVGQADEADDLLRKVRAHEPDVVITDICMPPAHSDDGLRVAETVRAELPGTGVLMLSQHVDDLWIQRLLAAGTAGVGYLLKQRLTELDRLAAAVRRVAAGGSVLDPEVVAQMVGRRRRDDPFASLTAREREVLQLMAEGRTNKAIAELNVVTERSVERHVGSIFHKLGLNDEAGGHRRVLAVLAFLGT